MECRGRLTVSGSWLWVVCGLLVIALAAGVCGHVGATAGAEKTGPATFYVDIANSGLEDGSSAHPFKSITNALGHVTPDRGDTIIVRAGVYAENVPLPAGTTLVSEEGAAHTEIQSDQGRKQAGVLVLDSGSILRGFTIRNLSAAAGSYAVYVKPLAQVELTNCVIALSVVGLEAGSGAAVSFVNNTVCQNTSGVQGASAATFPLLKNSIFVQNGVAIEADAQAVADGSHNAFKLNGQDFAGPSADPTDLLDTDPQFVEPGALNFHLKAGSPARNGGDSAPAFNDLDGSRNDLGADGGPHGVQDLLAPSAVIETTPDPPFGATPLLVQFNGATSSDEWGIASYSWEFELPDTLKEDATGPNVQHEYTIAGWYLARLTVTDNSGLSSHAVVEVAVGQEAPRASASADPIAGPAPLEVHFSGHGVDPQGGAVTYSWDFDGDTVSDSSEQNPVYTFPEGTPPGGPGLPGSYQATLTVSASGDRTATAIVFITITEGAVEQATLVEPDTGGTVAVEDPESELNGTEIDIPPGALSEAAVITVGPVVEVPEASQGDQVAICVQLGPSGLVFSVPVTVRIPFPTPPSDLSVIHVVFYNEATHEWSDAGISNVQYADGFITFQTTHFTVFGVIKKMGDIDVNGSVDAIDVQLVINDALDIPIAPYNGDANQDGTTDALDVQLVINGALGLLI